MSEPIPLATQCNALELQALGIQDWLDRAHDKKIKCSPEQIAVKEERLRQLQAAMATFRWFLTNEAAFREFSAHKCGGSK